MGQAQSLADNIPGVDALKMEFVRHTKVLSEINSLTYEEFKACLDDLNQLSRKCIDPQGKQLLFLIKRGSDSSVFWKATVKIACVKVDPTSRQIECYKFLNLKQFLCVFNTFQAYLNSLETSEQQRNSRSSSQDDSDGCATNIEGSRSGGIGTNITASLIMEHMAEYMGESSSSLPLSQGPDSAESNSNLSSPTTVSCSLPDSRQHRNHLDECSICLDGSTEVILPCAHGFCTPCIEQWNVNNKTCPICSETLNSTDDTWLLPDVPGIEEINEEICAELMRLAKTK